MAMDTLNELPHQYGGEGPMHVTPSPWVASKEVGCTSHTVATMTRSELLVAFAKKHKNAV